MTDKNNCKETCCCSTLFSIFNFLILSAGITAGVLSGLAAWGGTTLSFIVTLNEKTVSWCNTLSIAAASNSTHNATASSVCENITDYTLYAYFALGCVMFLMGIIGFIMTSCYNQGKKVCCLSFIYYLFFAIILIGLVALAIVGTIFYVSPDFIFNTLQVKCDNAQCTAGFNEFKTQMQIYSLGMMIAGYVGIFIFIIAVIAGSCILKIADTKKNTYGSSDPSSKYNLEMA